ncbi:TadE/TadG family type IV pilus assembly protein [Nocardioides sp. SYSU D00065]|uniref:TadE/TadG family type IV pilus assembly protein n=1 Tax=Nocardioides sp. SYSU D00065 TaxID=2817378 RepID=UPI001B31B77E|nr:TadE/TadG family type IV pilus assembly protein [Nocardioides sp. SYSU D00065]
MRAVRERGDDGAIAVMTALLTVVIFGMAALAIDIGMLAMERQKLHDAVDSAAHAGAYAMPGDGATAIKAARDMALSNDPDLTYDMTEHNPEVRLWCVVASTGTTPPAVQTSQIPSTCNPGPAPYTTSKYPDLRCNGAICKIPCAPSTTTHCNTVEVVAEKKVPFGFANIFDRSFGSTGSVASAACKGSCGAESPNPLDVVVVADRTLSLSSGDRSAMKTAIKDMLKEMDPSMHFLALGTIHKSETVSGCVSGAYSIPTPDRRNPLDEADMNRGTWVPTDFSNDYVTGAPGARAWKTTDPVYKAIDCLTSSDADYGTHLAAPMKEAARKLLGFSSSNLASLSSSNPRPGEVRKVIIFETDGQPNEKVSTSASNSVTVSGDPRKTDGGDACANLVKAAQSAKDHGILVMTIGFGDATTARCESGGRLTRDVLAEAASHGPSGPSTANSCSSTDAPLENADGDYFFCSARGSDFRNIFLTALSQVSKGVKLVRLP